MVLGISTKSIGHRNGWSCFFHRSFDLTPATDVYETNGKMPKWLMKQRHNVIRSNTKHNFCVVLVMFRISPKKNFIVSFWAAFFKIVITLLSIHVLYRKHSVQCTPYLSTREKNRYIAKSKWKKSTSFGGRSSFFRQCFFLYSKH